MPTQTRFIAPSGGTNLDLSGIFADLDGGTSYGSATNFKVGLVDLTGYFHASTSAEDRPNFNTNYKVNGTDLSAIFRRRGFVGLNITQQPTNQIVDNNTQAVFSVTATASGAITYQWYGPAGLISGATNSSYTIATATIANDGSYYCAVTSGGSTINSSTVVLKIKPYIVTQPVSVTDDDLETNGFSITAAGSATLKYTWYKGVSVVAGPRSGNISATQDQHTFQFNGATAGTYYCKVTNDPYDPVGVNSENATATIIPPIISVGIIGYTAPFTFGYNTVITITASASQGTNISYTFYGPNGQIQNGVGGYNIISANQIQFQLNTDRDGNYYAIGTNNGGSNQATAIAINMHPRITVQPQSTTITAGGNASFSVVAEGSGVLTYTWYRNGSTFGAANSPTFVEVGAPSAYNGYTYYCIVSSSASGTTPVQSSTATLTVNYAPANMTLSGQEIYNLGNNASFTANITLGNPNSTTYTWYRSTNGGVSYSQVAQTVGSTSSSNTYTEFSVTNSMSGYKYYCVANNSIGSVTVTEANRKNLYINPNIITQPTDQTVDVGETAVFTVSAGGSSLSYTWYRSTNGGASYSTFGAANNPTYAAVNVASSDNGYKYYCVVSSSIGGTTQATSSVVTLTVQFAPTIGSVSVNGSTVTSNLQVFSISNGALITLTASNVNDGQPNASGGWYRWGGSSYNEFLSSNLSYQFTQANYSTEYYIFILTNIKGTAESYEIEINTS